MKTTSFCEASQRDIILTNSGRSSEEEQNRKKTEKNIQLGKLIFFKKSKY